MNQQKWIKSVLTILTLSLVIPACGGGGDGGIVTTNIGSPDALFMMM